jgi:hypothetical protein
MQRVLCLNTLKYLQSGADRGLAQNFDAKGLDLMIDCVRRGRAI